MRIQSGKYWKRHKTRQRPIRRHRRKNRKRSWRFCRISCIRFKSIKRQIKCAGNRRTTSPLQKISRVNKFLRKIKPRKNPITQTNCRQFSYLTSKSFYAILKERKCPIHLDFSTIDRKKSPRYRSYGDFLL